MLTYVEDGLADLETGTARSRQLALDAIGETSGESAGDDLGRNAG
jgi:hypothetical protein